MPIVLCRVDDRLVHGQVVIGWGRPLGVEFIVLVDEGVAASPWEQDLYRMAVPPEIEIRFATVAEASAAAGRVAGGRRAAASSSPAISIRWRRSIRANPAVVHRINLGGMHHRPGRRERLPYLYLTDEELRGLVALEADGAEVTAQDLPTSAPVRAPDARHDRARAAHVVLLVVWGTRGGARSGERAAGDALAPARGGHGGGLARRRRGGRTPGRRRARAVRARRAAHRRGAVSGLRAGHRRGRGARGGRAVGAGARAQRRRWRWCSRSLGGWSLQIGAALERALDSAPRGGARRRRERRDPSSAVRRAAPRRGAGRAAHRPRPGRRVGARTRWPCSTGRPRSASRWWPSAPGSSAAAGGAVRSAGRGARLRWLVAGAVPGTLLAVLR